MKWFEIVKKKPKGGQIVWLSRPTLKDRTPVAVRYSWMGTNGPPVWIKGNKVCVAVRSTDQWAEPVVPVPPKLLRGG